MPSSFTLTADVKLNPQSLTQSASQVKQALGRITGQASEFQKSLDASTARVFAFGATTVVLNSVSQAFRKLISSTIEVEQRIVEINAIFQQSQSVINNFREAIFDVAQDTGQAFETVADAAGELARQGLTAEETATRLQAALILTRISGLGAEDSVKTLTAAINGFTSAALDAEEVTNKIVAVDTAFAVSAQDLAQGLARAGSTAEDAGVSFDQLLGLITAVEQRTARGGAVIGNAFKSIFTRLSRGSTIDDLQALGVEIDATQTGVQKLQALSTAIEGIGDPTVVSKIKELAGGVFQINVVSAALKDLTSETSVFKKATVEAANASDDAYKRNEELNKSLAAQINSLVQGITNLAAKIGTLTFGPLLTNLISIAGKITEVFNNALDPEKGNAIVKAFIKGIGVFLSGPGLVIITAAFLKIVGLVAKFAADGFKAVLQIGSAAEKVSQIEGGIVDLLSRDKELRKIIASTTATQAQKEEAVIKAIKRENQLLREQKALLSSLTALATKRGVSGFNPASGFSGGKRRRLAEGYVPNYARSSDFALEKQEAISLGATKSVKAKIGKGTIGGKKFVMNNQETEIPNFGRNGDSAVIPNYATGYVPNYANKQPPPLPKGRYGTNNQWVSANKVKGVSDSALFTQDNDFKFYPFKAKGIKLTHDEIVREGGAAIRARYKEWEKTENSKRIETVDLNQIVGGPLPSILIPRKASSKNAVLKSQKTDILKPIDYKFPVKGISGENTEKLEAKFEKDFDPERIEKIAKKRVLRFARQITDSLGLPKGEPKDIKKTKEVDGFTGAVRAAAGAVFDASVTTALNIKSKDPSKKKGGNFDVRGKNPNLKALFGESPTPSQGPFTGLADFKFSPDTDSLRKKSLKELSVKYKDSYEELKLERNPDKKGKPTVKVPKKATKKARKKAPKARRKGLGFASGYIPNFAAGGILGDLLRGKETTDFAAGGALGEAIQREKAAGLPKSKIRVERSKRLINRDNPSGLAVTNTIDEPRGLKDVFAQGRDKEKQGFAKGYVPNFAAAAAARSVTGFLTKNTKSLSKETGSLSKKTGSLSGETDVAKKALAQLGGAYLAGAAVSFAGTKITESANREREAEIEAINKSAEARKKEINARGDLTQSEKEVRVKLIDDKAAGKTKEVGEKKTFAEQAVPIANIGVQALIFKDQIASAGKGIGEFGKNLGKKGKLGKRTKKGTQTDLEFDKKGKIKGGKTIDSKGRILRTAAKGKKGKIASTITAKGIQQATKGSVTRIATQVGGRLVAAAAGTIGLAVASAAGGYAIGTALDKADLNPIQRLVEGGSQKEVAKKEDVENRNKNFERATEVIPLRLEAILAKAFPEQGNQVRQDRDKEIDRINNSQLDDRGKKRQIEFTRQAADPEGIITELRKSLPKREFEYLKSATAEYAAALEKAARKEALGQDGSVIRNNADNTFDKKIKVAKGGGEAKILKKYSALIGQQVSIQQAINSITQRRAEVENEILSSQIKEGLIRKNIIKTLNRSKSLLPKDVLAAGGDKLVDADIATIKNQEAKSKADKLGTKAQDLTAQFAAKRQEVERNSPQIQRLNELNSKEEAVTGLSDDDKKEKNRLEKQVGSITGEFDALQKEKEQAVIDFTNATDEYNNSVLDGAQNIRLGLRSIAEKIKSNGSEAMIRAFEEFESLAENPNELDPSKFKSAADGFFRALEVEVKRQYATNAVAAGNFYSKVVKDLQNPAQSGKDIEKSVAGLQALNSDNVSDQEKINILAEIQPLLGKIQGERGAESAQFQEVLKKAFGSKDRESATALFEKLTKELASSAIDNRVGSTYAINRGAEEDNAAIIEKNKPKDPEKFAQQQTELFNSYDKLTAKLKLYEKQFESAKSVKTATDELVLAIESASSTVQLLESGFSAAGSFGEKANDAIEASQKNIENLVQTAGEMTTNLRNLSEKEKNIAAAITAVQAVVDVILTQRGAGGGSQ